MSANVLCRMQSAPTILSREADKAKVKPQKQQKQQQPMKRQQRARRRRLSIDYEACFARAGEAEMKQWLRDNGCRYVTREEVKRSEGLWFRNTLLVKGELRATKEELERGEGTWFRDTPVIRELVGREQIVESEALWFRGGELA